MDAVNKIMKMDHNEEFRKEAGVMFGW
jgi:hypothetical protein